MNRLPANLPALLRAEGLHVVEIDGWQTRSRPASTGGFNPVGVLNHHTGDKTDGKPYAKWLATVGRPDLPAPLCHLSIGRDGTVYICAAGRANHAGKARAAGSVAAGDGNSLYVGIEWQLTGTESIPASMYVAGVKTNQVLLRLLGSSTRTVHCHYETSTTGKWDIGDPQGIRLGDHRVLDVDKFRAAVGKGLTPPPPAPPVKVGQPRSAPNRWAKFLHLSPYSLNNSIEGLEVGRTRGYTAVDLDFHMTADHVWANVHWGDLREHRRNGRPVSLPVARLDWSVVKELRDGEGRRIRNAGVMLAKAKELGYKRVEVEPKDTPTVRDFRRLKRHADRVGIEVVVKRLIGPRGIPGGLECLTNAHKAGLPTMGLPRGRRGSLVIRLSKDYWPVTDYVRVPKGHTIRWAA